MERGLVRVSSQGGMFAIGVLHTYTTRICALVHIVFYFPG